MGESKLLCFTICLLALVILALSYQLYLAAPDHTSLEYNVVVVPPSWLAEG
jgi:hypothetical protein